MPFYQAVNGRVNGKDGDRGVIHQVYAWQYDVGDKSGRRRVEESPTQVRHTT